MTIKQDLPIVLPIAEYDFHLFTNIQKIPVLQGEDGFLYTAITSMCDLFGLDQEVEADRIQQHTILKTKLAKANIHDQSAQLCMRIGFIGTWLLNLPINAVKEKEDREDLVTFQQNAAQVFEEAFCAGRLTEWPLIAGLLEKEDPTVFAYNPHSALKNELLNN